jgi:L-rhamnose mutarotase
MAHFYDLQGNLVDPWQKDALPSPSTILDLIKHKGIDAFRARVGEEEAEAHMVAAQERGTRVHTACETWLANGNDAIKAAITADLRLGEEQYLGGFINWWETFNPILIASEKFLINKTLRYAGRTDLVVILDGQLWIVDIKTGMTRVKHGLQVKFYAEALKDMVMRNLVDVEGLSTKNIRMGGLYLDAKRACGYRYFKSEYGMLEYKESLSAIKAHLTVYRWWAKKEPVKSPEREGDMAWGSGVTSETV